MICGVSFMIYGCLFNVWEVSLDMLISIIEYVPFSISPFTHLLPTTRCSLRSTYYVLLIVGTDC